MKIFLKTKSAKAMGLVLASSMLLSVPANAGYIFSGKPAITLPKIDLKGGLTGGIKTTTANSSSYTTMLANAYKTIKAKAFENNFNKTVAILGGCALLFVLFNSIQPMFAKKATKGKKDLLTNNAKKETEDSIKGKSDSEALNILQKQKEELDEKMNARDGVAKIDLNESNELSLKSLEYANKIKELEEKTRLAQEAERKRLAEKEPVPAYTDKDVEELAKILEQMHDGLKPVVKAEEEPIVRDSDQNLFPTMPKDKVTQSNALELRNYESENNSSSEAEILTIPENTQKEASSDEQNEISVVKKNDQKKFYTDEQTKTDVTKIIDLNKIVEDVQKKASKEKISKFKDFLRDKKYSGKEFKPSDKITVKNTSERKRFSTKEFTKQANKKTDDIPLETNSYIVYE